MRGDKGSEFNDVLKKELTPERSKEAEMFVRGRDLSNSECKKILRAAKIARKTRVISMDVYLEISRIVEEQRKKND